MSVDPRRRFPPPLSCWSATCGCFGWREADVARQGRRLRRRPGSL